MNLNFLQCRRCVCWLNTGAYGAYSTLVGGRAEETGYGNHTRVLNRIALMLKPDRNLKDAEKTADPHVTATPKQLAAQTFGPKKPALPTHG